MKEVACQFADENRLVGVVSLPDTPDTKVALILITAGLTTKSGPFRLYTQLAREAARNGFLSLRFDLGGIGNSEQIHAGLPLAERTKLDIEAALNFVQQNYQIDAFILGGLCSGAEDSFYYAEEDPRVKGVVLMDGHAYVTKGWWWRHVFSRRFFGNMVARILRKVGLFKLVTGAVGNTDSAGSGGGLIDYQRMSYENSSRILRALLRRKAKLHYIYTGGLRDCYNYKNQFYDMFPNIEKNDQVKITFVPQMEHTQIFQEDRKELVNTISSWLKTNFHAA